MVFWCYTWLKGGVIKMKSLEITLTALMVGIGIGAALITLLCAHTNEPHTKIIEHGCAEYDNTTGKFQFLKKDNSGN